MTYFHELLLLIFIALKSILVHSETISIDSNGQYQDGVINCNGNSDCIIICDGTDSCRNAIINCPKHYSCDITCSATTACMDTTFHCPINHSCSITCTGTATNTPQSCAKSIINATYSSIFTLNDCSTGYWTCYGLTIYFPPNINGTKRASITGDRGLSAGSMSGSVTTPDVIPLQFYALYGWNDVNVINFDNDGNWDEHQGVMYCTDNFTSTSCNFAAESWSCDPHGDTTCNNPPIPTVLPITTTASPTSIPSSNPTTQNPTTLYPTTAIPTTLNPTPSTMTTLEAITTSSSPTSVSLTTNMPTTNIPININSSTYSPSQPETTLSTTIQPQTSKTSDSESVTVRAETVKPTTNNWNIPTTQSKSSTLSWLQSINNLWYIVVVLTLFLCCVTCCLLYFIIRSYKMEKALQTEFTSSFLASVDNLRYRQRASSQLSSTNTMNIIAHKSSVPSIFNHHQNEPNNTLPVKTHSTYTIEEGCEHDDDLPDIEMPTVQHTRSNLSECQGARLPAKSIDVDDIEFDANTNPQISDNNDYNNNVKMIPLCPSSLYWQQMRYIQQMAMYQKQNSMPPIPLPPPPPPPPPALHAQYEPNDVTKNSDFTSSGTYSSVGDNKEDEETLSSDEYSTSNSTEQEQEEEEEEKENGTSINEQEAYQVHEVNEEESYDDGISTTFNTMIIKDKSIKMTLPCIDGVAHKKESNLWMKTDSV